MCISKKHNFAAIEIYLVVIQLQTSVKMYVCVFLKEMLPEIC